MVHQPSETFLTGANQRKKRPTIGFFNLEISNDYALWPWQGIVDAARERDVNLVTYIGSIVGWNSIRAQANVLYDLAKDSHLDGLIIWKAGLMVCLSETEAEQFSKQYHIPVVTLEGRVSGLICVSYDNYQGMRSAVEHLIDVHGYKRIGFLGMHEHHTGFQERYRAYVDAMTAHGLPIDPRLARPWFPIDEITPSSTIDERILASYLDDASSLGMEAIIGTTDSITQQVQSALQERGIRVPGDVAVVGFDDSVEGRVLTPPLTTVKPSWYEFGHLAAEALIDLLGGKSVPELVNVPAVLMVRQSCGCQDPCFAAVTAEPFPASATSPEPTFTYPDIALAMIQAALVNEPESIQREIEPLFKKLVAELTGGKTGDFLNALSDALQRSTATMDELSYWHNAMSALRQQILTWLNQTGQETGRFETLLQQAQVLISRVAERTQMLRNFRAAEKELDFQRVSMSLLTTLDLNTLMDTLASELPGLGIPGCYLSFFENPQPYRYPDPAPEWARLILAYGPQGRTQLASHGLRFPARQLIPDELWPQDRACSFILLSLHFQQEQLGFVLFESGSRTGRMYETLQTQISSALQGALLMQRVQERSAELARQQYILDTFMENVPDSIYFKNLESRITRTNRAHAIRMGLGDPAEEIGKSDFDFFPEEQARPKFEQEQEIIRTGHPLLNLEEPDGRGRWALTTKMPLRNELGEVIGTFGISRDITALKKTQAALERAYAEVEQQVQERTAQLRQEIIERQRAETEREALIASLEAKNAELERFTYTVSHDLKSPLITIRGFLGYIEQDIQSGDMNRLKGDMQRIIVATDKMQRLLNELLELSRIGRLMNPSEVVAFETIVGEALELVRGRLEVRRVQVELAPGLPVIFGDRVRLVEVVQNLLDNAAKFMGDQVEPQITIGQQGYTEDGKPILFVRDNGIGIDSQYRERVFGLFEKLNPQSEGTGIGLALVKRIVEVHGGSIWLESEGYDKGSTFYFTLPCPPE